ncbi:MAG: TRAP transporter small permease subunit [Ideonella sp.]|jgi:TRAP-type C4-dicarboxylate transport system permease small subunit|nr:TRAP transporter small permease subunit [Ideonella sp.]
MTAARMAGAPAAPGGVVRAMAIWHRVECLVAVAAFGFIAVVLIGDVLGREVLGPIYRAFNIKGQAGVYAAQKMSVYALVVGSFCGVGIATATASHLLPRVGFGWVPSAWGPMVDRIADVITGSFMLGVAWFGCLYVQSSMTADLRAQAFNIPIWPIQAAIPAGFASAGLRYFFFAAWPVLRPLAPEFQE